MSWKEDGEIVKINSEWHVKKSKREKGKKKKKKSEIILSGRCLLFQHKQAHILLRWMTCNFSFIEEITNKCFNLETHNHNLIPKQCSGWSILLYEYFINGFFGGALSLLYIHLNTTLTNMITKLRAITLSVITLSICIKVWYLHF